MAGARWASFDCYGTLVDWNGGIGGQLERLFGVEPAPRLLARYHELEPAVQVEAYRSYREVLTETLIRLAAEQGLAVPEGDEAALARSLPSWPAFPEVPAALAELRARGWRLAILSNTDRDLIAGSERQLGVPFDVVVVAQDIGSYKPAHRHWEAFTERAGVPAGRHVHVAASLFHDIVPASELGLTSVWINRLGESLRPGATPARELPDLRDLPDTLDALVPA
jgi:2-haloacid dehalogenase